MSFADSGCLVLNDWLWRRFSQVSHFLTFSFSLFGNFLVPNDFSQFSHFPIFLFLSFWNFSGTQWLAFPGFHFLCFTFPTEDKVLLSSQKWNLHICFSAQENILQNLIIFRIIYKKFFIIFRKSKYFQSFNRKVVDYSENGTASWNISHFISFPKYLPFNSFDNIWLIIPILH